MSALWSKVRVPLLWIFRMLVVLLLLFIAEAHVENISELATGRPVVSESALGMSLSQGSSGRLGWREVLTIDPGGAADIAGVQVGDEVKFATVWGDAIAWQPGEHVAVTVQHGESASSAILIARQPELTRGEWQQFLATEVARLVGFGFSLLLLIRGRGNRAATMLGLFLLGFNGAPQGRAWLPHWIVAPFMLGTGVPVLWAPLSLYFIVFALELSGGAASRRQERLAYGLGAALIPLTIFEAMLAIFAIPFPLDPSPLNFLLVVLNQASGLGILAWNYRRNDAAGRNRIKIAGAAFPVFVLSIAAQNIMEKNGVDPVTAQWLRTAGTFCTYALLAYAVLRQRLFDIGFAINRTLVYGSVSFIMLAAFGLAEWGAERVMPESWHEGSLLFSAGIAVILFLSFHRMRDWIERHVERLFFSEWQRAEAALKRFVESAGHFDRMPVLCGSFSEAISRFAGGVPAALYLQDGDGTYKLETGELAGTAPSYDDDTAFALMRAERKPVDLSQADGKLPGRLALPMLDQGNLIGFALLAAKADGANYRPDEVQNLGWAAHLVGLDLQALQARELRAEVARLNAENAILNGKLTDVNDKFAWLEEKTSGSVLTS